jgi:RNA polymerase sigma-70 factor (ECF subfamily)
MEAARLAPEAVRVALATLTDIEVVRRVVAGDRASFEILMRRHNTRVWRAIRSILRDDAEAEDAMQQAWLSAYQHLPQFQGGSAFSTWLTRIALNEALARLRRRNPLALAAELEEEAMESTTPPALDPERRAAGRQLVALLEEAIDALPVNHRTVIMLREVEGLSTAETAEAMGVSDEVVKVRLHRAKAALRDALYERTGEAAGEAFTFLAPRCNRMVAAVFARLPAPSAA